MRNLLLCFIFVLTIAACQDSQRDEILVKFKVNCSSLPEDSQVYIVGNHHKLGSWDPAAIAMKRESDEFWTYDLVLDSAQNLEYKFTLGSWANEALSSQRKKFQNFTLLAVGDTSVTHSISSFGTGMAEPTVVGNLTIIENVKSSGLQPRDLLIWTPPGYSESAKRYPVLYMHDGQNVFDVATSGFGMEWEVDESCVRLFEDGSIPEMMVVATTSTSERSADYGMGEQGKRYMEFLATEIKPTIDAEYRTLAERDQTYCGGASMGGLISFRLAWEHSDVFSKAICMSPAFKYDNFDFSAQIVDTKSPMAGTRFYIDNGGVGIETKLQPGIDNMLEFLEKRKLQSGKDYFYLVDSKAEHNENAWASRFPSAIQLLLKSK